jgi:hypothetical protein
MRRRQCEPVFSSGADGAPTPYGEIRRTTPGFRPDDLAGRSISASRSPTGSPLTNGGWCSPIADDVGLGKTLSMAAAALVLSLLDDKPILILAPSTLIWQWQEELDDKLGIPAAVWSTQKKCWLDEKRRPLTQRGDPELVAKCPWRIGIVSTGLIIHGDDAGERGALAKKSFGVVVLDEAHKARAPRETTRRVRGRMDRCRAPRPRGGEEFFPTGRAGKAADGASLPSRCSRR